MVFIDQPTVSPPIDIDGAAKHNQSTNAVDIFALLNVEPDVSWRFMETQQQISHNLTIHKKTAKAY